MPALGILVITTLRLYASPPSELVAFMHHIGDHRLIQSRLQLKNPGVTTIACACNDLTLWLKSLLLEDGVCIDNIFLVVYTMYCATIIFVWV